MNGEGATCPLIYFQRLAPSSSPFKCGTHLDYTQWQKRRCGEGERVRGKKNVEMFSSGCNLSLSWLQHSRVILQHSPVRHRGSSVPWPHTSSHPSETPALTRLPQSALLLLLLLLLSCAMLSCLFSRSCVFTLDSQHWSLEFYPVRLLSDVALVMKQPRAKLPIIGYAIDKSISFVSVLRKNIIVLNMTYFLP